MSKDQMFWKKFFCVWMFVCCLNAGCDNHQFHEIACEECKGTGKVVYGKDHWIVINNIDEAGVYLCPMCEGTGKLYEERK